MAAPGIKTAAFIGFDNNSRAERKMEAGFMVGCRSRNIRVKEDWNVYLGCSSYENGYGAAREVLSKIELPSAWLVADSRLAGGIMVIKTAVPEQVSRSRYSFSIYRFPSPS